MTLFGDWAEGYFSMTFVGALNVGSMTINFDSDLVTNKSKNIRSPFYFDKNYLKDNGNHSVQSVIEQSNHVLNFEKE